MHLLLTILSAQARPSVVILISEPIDEYIEPSESFQESFDGPTQVIHLHRDYEKALLIASDLSADPPPLIYAVGKEAAYLAAQEIKTVPVLYAMVHNPERYGIYGENVSGIRIEPPAELVLSQFRLFAPNVKKIAVFASDNPPTEIYSSALQAAARGHSTNALEVIRANAGCGLHCVDADLLGWLPVLATGRVSGRRHRRPAGR